MEMLVINSEIPRVLVKERKFVPEYVMKTYDGMKAQFYSFLTSKLEEWSASRPGRFTAVKEPSVPIK
jgi:hypothetical protein